MSRSPENILLRLPEAQEQSIREIFAQLEQRGFPRQQQTPHITITFAPAMAPEVVASAAELLPAVIPSTLTRVGAVVFGTKRKQTVAWLLEASDELEIAARSISALNPAGRGPRWTPHLTMGLRLPRDIVPDYLHAMDELVSPHLKEFTAFRAEYYRPQSQESLLLAESGMDVRRSQA
ncbi:LigT-like phosphoesterase [Arthrobacter sp. AG1021]|uniref:2'-5' RNA ligase family protein n=1 Tax=Arthrobacter sp. AG1021 TaxID=2183908 RepID=UPI000EAE1736|nr:2'-5' RNA ligase family protein [Arthrobacter sp. AG1021]RKS22377.1 LigT-like phosphoesterase [Arthrobacter sp. AG1021]